MPEGSVKFFHISRGFGFVAPSDGGEDIFFHVSQFDGDEDALIDGARVKFEIGEGRRPGKTEAKKLEIIE